MRAPRFESVGAAALLLFTASLAVRAAMWFCVSPLRPAFDEKSYVLRGESMAGIARAVRAGEDPSPLDLTRVYADGVWPPLFPALVAVGLSEDGDERGARLLGVLVSSATTLLVFFATLQIADRRAAVAAGALHAAHPSFIAYAHLLWSETLFIAALMASVCAALSTRAARDPRRRAFAAAGCGVFLGLAALTRASAVTGLIAVPVWLAFALERSERRFAHAALVFGVALAVIAPWEAVLYGNEGHPVVLSSATGYNLLKLNADFTSKAAVREAIDSYAAEHDVAPDRAGMALALRAIADDLPRFVERSWLRFRRVFGMDEFVLRHLVQVHYPPLPHGMLIAVAAWLGATTLLWTGLAVLGLVSGIGSAAGRGLLALLIVTGLVAPVVAIGNSRMGLPLVALGIPFAGIGLANLRALRETRTALATGLAVLLCLASLITLPSARSAASPRAGFVSGWYRQLRDPIGWLKPPGSATLDCVKLRAQGKQTPGEVTITLADPAYAFREPLGDRIVWRPAEQPSLLMDVLAETAAGPLVLELRAHGTQQRVALRPITRELLRTWLPSGIPGVEARWCGVRSSHQGRDF